MREDMGFEEGGGCLHLGMQYASCILWRFSM